MAAARITRDPTQDIVPDYNNDPDWNDFVDSCVTNTRTLQAWEAQLEVDRREEEICLRTAEETQKQLEKEAEKEKAEEEKKCFRPPPMDQKASVPTNPQASPLPFALEKMQKYDYVELWYFGMEGCEEARLNSFVDSTTGYSFSAIGEDAATVALRPLSTLTKLSKAIPDDLLSFTQLSIAKTLYVQTMTELGWPADYCRAWAHFYTILENHRFGCYEPHGEQVLVKYHAQVKRDWHRLILAKKAVFNVAIINEELIARIEDDVLRQMRLENMVLVGFVYHIQQTHC
ncbi:hypothetical protein BT96DRAFT_1044961 [Gymnopus androsaceus JB14]|uniref:Uncharacterized protein n=1 Tax=Gymnopus androsaceus JB14 TaxID=1447944 RepID=A0A6A4HBI6_9AGAR|nr:hypothetical protein BT96DRAFT_1044961 [Gymnopus androsaceus JB14]